MIENFYEFDNSLKEQMIEELFFLKRVIHCWRAVARDGNCFYRSVAFAYLEYLIFNRKINILIIIMTKLYTKFDPSNPKIKNLPDKIKRQFLTHEKIIAITILEIIIRLLKINKVEQNYITLVKAYNATRVFDGVMIFYIRYLIYEYICDNQDKLFKKAFPILLGYLLPKVYQRPDGTFSYNDYFTNDLLIYFTCADRLAVYLIPYVLKINLNIIFYYPGKQCDIETKFIPCELLYKDKKVDTITLLYRKAHYDICFNQDYHYQYKPLLNKYCYLNSKLKKDIYILNPDDVAKQEKILNQIAPLNEEKSLSFNRVKFEKLKNKKIEEIKDKSNEENKKFTKVIYDGIANNSNNKKCFICNKELSNRIKLKHFLVNVLYFFVQMIANLIIINAYVHFYIR